MTNRESQNSRFSRRIQESGQKKAPAGAGVSGETDQRLVMATSSRSRAPRRTTPTGNRSRPSPMNGAGYQHLSSASQPRWSYQASPSGSVTASRVSWQANHSEAGSRCFSIVNPDCRISLAANNLILNNKEDVTQRVEASRMRRLTLVRVDRVCTNRVLR